MSHDSLLLTGALAATLAAAIYAGAEIVFLTLEPIRLPGRLKRGDYGAKRIGYFLARPEQFFSTSLALCNLFGVIYSSLAALYLEHRGMDEYSILIVTSIFLLVFGEAIPKAFARQFAELLAPAVASILYVSRMSVWPLLWMVEQSVRHLQRWFGLPPSTTGTIYSRSDIANAITLAHLTGDVTPGEATLIHRLLKLQGRTVGELMTPRTRVTTIPLSATPTEAVELAERTGHKRLICFGDDQDDVLGVIHSIDLLRGTESLSSILRPLRMTPESLPVRKLTGWFRNNHTHFAGVLDEHGGFAGVVCIEDLAEELVGPIDDIEKPDRSELLRVTPRLWLVRGKTRISHMAGMLGFEPQDVKSATVGGWVSELADGIPEEGEEFITAGVVVRVIKANPRGALLVRITLPESVASQETT